MVQTGHLFVPMPDVIRDDMAFIDRLHFYLSGWELPQMRNELFTDHYGFTKVQAWSLVGDRVPQNRLAFSHKITPPQLS